MTLSETVKHIAGRLYADKFGDDWLMWYLDDADASDHWEEVCDTCNDIRAEYPDVKIVDTWNDHDSMVITLSTVNDKEEK